MAAERLLLETEDESAVSVRAVADAVGVTPPSIYLHFADKTELMLAVCQRQFDKLDVVVNQAIEGIADPLEMLRRRAQAYIDFGVAHPEHYRVLLMGKRGLSREDFEAGRLPGIGSLLGVVENVQACMDSGVFARDDPFLVACGLWAAVHGLTSLRITMPGFPILHDPDTLGRHLTQVILDGLGPRGAR